MCQARTIYVPVRATARPAHPDRVLTSVMMKSLTDLGMTYIHLSPDLQLYIQAMQIKWSEPRAFDWLILRPGVMHIEQNVCGCIGQLMMGSGLADPIGSAFGGGGSIMAQGNHGCVRCPHSEWYLQFSCNHSCRSVSRRAMRSVSTLIRHVCILDAVSGWITSSPRLCSLTSCCAPKEWGIGSFNSSAFDVSSRTFSSLATTTMQDTSHGIASKWLYYNCLPWQRTTYSLAHLSADTRRAAGMQCRPTSSGSRRQYNWERWTDTHHVIPGTSGGMDRLISHISIRIRCTRRHTKKKVSRDALLILMTVDASAKNSIHVLIHWRLRAMFCTTS